MVTGWMTAGNAEDGLILHTPLVALQPVSVLGLILNSMVSASAVVLASCMAALKVHWSPTVPVSTSHAAFVRSASAPSPVELTMKMVAAWAGLVVACEPNNTATENARTKKASVLALPTHIDSGTVIVAMPLSLSLALLLSI